MTSKLSIQADRNQNIKVYVRCRPINEQERKARNQICVDVNDPKKSITVKTHHDKTFTFDGTFGRDSNQIDVYKSVVQPLITEVLQGYNCTVFAYGQTGTGKTYTMEGVRSESLLSWQHDPHAGIVPRALHQIFSEVGDTSLTIIKVSFLELYNEELFDLLGSCEQQSSKLKIYEDASAKGSVVVKGLEEVIVRDRQEVYALMERGASRRQVAATLMNASSSRSHTIFTITVISKDTNDTGVDLMRTGKLNLVDLAGSENIGRSGAQDKRAREAGNINQSLLTLGRVITALVERTPHVPYRESKLTRLLQDSLGGRTKTSIIATISPAQINIEETLSTLEYAFRAKNIMNRPEVNQKLCKEIVLKHMTDELEQLRRDLIACREKNGVYIDETNYRTMQSRLDLQSEELQKKAEETVELNQRIDLLQTQIDEIKQLFDDSKQQLQIENFERQKAQTRLKEVNFNYTAAKVAIKAHLKTEEELHEDAHKLITATDLAKADIGKLHEKVDRQRVLEEHNLKVMEQLLSILSSSIDSTNRKVEDAFKDLSKTSALKDQAIKGLREESKLLQDSDCLLGSLLKTHLQKRTEFLQKLSGIEEKSISVATELSKQSTEDESFVERTMLKMNESFCTDLISNIRDTKRSLDNELSSLNGALNEHGIGIRNFGAASQLDLHSLNETTQNMRNKVVTDLGRSKDIINNQCEEISTVMRSLEDLQKKLSATQVELRQTSQIQEVVSGLTTELSSEIDSHRESLTKKLSSFVDSSAKETEIMTEKITAARRIIADKEEEQLSKIDVSLSRNRGNFEQYRKQLKESTSSIIGNVDSVRAEVQYVGEMFTLQSGSEMIQMADIGERLSGVSIQLTETGARLVDLKHGISEKLNKDVQRYQKTGATPARRSYDVPRVLPKTQPINVLQAKLQSKYEKISFEERTALDEGASFLLDVTASPEMLDFDASFDGSQDDKENSFSSMDT